MMSEEYFVVPLQKVLQEYMNNHFKDHPLQVRRLPMTGAVQFDSWIEHEEVVFRVVVDDKLAGGG